MIHTLPNGSRFLNADMHLPCTYSSKAPMPAENLRISKGSPYRSATSAQAQLSPLFWRKRVGVACCKQRNDF